MSAVASAARPGNRATPAVGLVGAARRYHALVAGAAIAAVATAAATSSSHPHAPLGITITLLAAATAAQAAAIQIRRNQVFHTGLAFIVAAVVLLPPAAIVLICIVQHTSDWIRQRYPWYIQTFNIANYTLSALAASAAKAAAQTLVDGSRGGASTAAAALAAGITFILVNHALLARMLVLARGHTLASTRLFSPDSLLADAVLAACGIIIATLLRDQPAVAPLAALPLLLIHRALASPQLAEQAIREPKTNLLNPRGLEEAAANELARASRTKHPLSLVLIDINDLRGLNNRHGHLTGDAALRQLADALRHCCRPYDTSARWGGDEFITLLPETSTDEAQNFIDRLHHHLATTPIHTNDGHPIYITATAGTATSTPQTDLKSLIDQADQHMYAAKPHRHQPHTTIKPEESARSPI